jgi:Flp pilus assembly protein TadG
LAFRSDKGAVTAEFMLITPAMILAVTLLISLFPLALAGIKLELSAMQLARLHAFGQDVEVPTGYSIEFSQQGKLSCLKLRMNTLPMESEYCAIPIG